MFNICLCVWVKRKSSWFGTETNFQSHISYIMPTFLFSFCSHSVSHIIKMDLFKSIFIPHKSPQVSFFAYIFKYQKFLSSFPFYFAHTSYYDISMTLSGLQKFFFIIFGKSFFFSLYEPERQRHPVIYLCDYKVLSSFLTVHC